MHRRKPGSRLRTRAISELFVRRRSAYSKPEPKSGGQVSTTYEVSVLVQARLSLLLDSADTRLQEWVEIRLGGPAEW